MPDEEPARFKSTCVRVYTNDGDECGEVKADGPVSDQPLFYPNGSGFALEASELRSIADRIEKMADELADSPLLT